MRPVIQQKIDAIKAIARNSASTGHEGAKAPRVVSDNLSKAIRNKRDAEIFQKELEVAFRQAKK
ncbi:hypothetical protein SAMN05216436_1304 [bacterium A37T11]|nr:hypothetical protein SAMN05216436_1304 [bacterium A37T11]